MRNTAQQRGVTGNVEALLQSLLYTAPNDVINLFGGNLRACALENTSHQMTGQGFSTDIYGILRLWNDPWGYEYNLQLRRFSFSIISVISRKEYIAIGGHFTGFVSYLIHLTEVCVFVSQFDELGHTHGINVTEYTATEWREAQSVNQDPCPPRQQSR